MTFRSSMSAKLRDQGSKVAEKEECPIRGAGLRIEYENGKPSIVYPVEHSMVLHIEQRRIGADKRRRLGLVEWWGDKDPPAHASRHIADLFGIDSDTLAFAIQAMREKIQRDAEQGAGA